MDSLITVGCLSRHGREVRLHELHDAINILSKLPRVVVYLDAGAADALPAQETARLLRRAGVAKIQGFFLNSTHFDWTSREIRYGEQISRMTGGKHFVVNTAENGRGPLRPEQPGSLRQRGPLQPARARARAAADVQHRLPQRRRVRLDRQSGQVGRPVPAGRAADRLLLAEAGARAGAQRGLPGAVGPASAQERDRGPVARVAAVVAVQPQQLIDRPRLLPRGTTGRTLSVPPGVATTVE